VVLVSIDEKLLEEVCTPTTESGVNFIVDGQGRVVACPASQEIGRALFSPYAGETERQSAYRRLVTQTGLLESENLSICSVYDEKTGWTIVRATDQEALLRSLRQQQRLIISLTTLSLLVLLAAIVGLVVIMTRSIKRVAETMRKAGSGDLSVHVAPDILRPSEIEIIADTFNQTMERLKCSIDKQHSAEITALEAQINPHFLYNTMDTIIWLIEADRSQAAVEMVSNLSDFFRHSLSRGEDIISLGEEERHVRSYLQIQQARYKDILSYTIAIDPALRGTRLPKLTLQPLVENALYHGIKRKRGRGCIRITSQVEGADVLLRIADDGAGMSPVRLEELSRAIESGERVGFGLAAVHERLRLQFGSPYGLTLASREGKGTTVTVRFPWREREEAER